MRKFNGKSKRYRTAIFAEKEAKCERCGYDEVPQILIAHHKNRNRTDNALENLEILCPTCHESEHFRNKDGRFGTKNWKHPKAPPPTRKHNFIPPWWESIKHIAKSEA